MPYKLSNDEKSVLVLRKGRWVLLKRHKTKQGAIAHLRALRINVEH
jgi:hypothetical protein